MKSRGAPTTAGSITALSDLQTEEREGSAPLDRPLPGTRSRPVGDTAVSIEREVVFGHAYAILAPHAADGGRCGYDNPANLPVDGVFDP